MPELSVSSEIYTEYDYQISDNPTIQGNVISAFKFMLPSANTPPTYDEDNDLDIERPRKEIIKIEHSPRTNLALVGLQVWRGAFLLADLIIHLGVRGDLKHRRVLELGAGTGITSFVAGMFADRVICTDIDIGGILSLIKLNAKYNARLIKSQFKVLPLNFKDTNWSETMTSEIKQAHVILAADVIYDDDVTAAFISTIQNILNIRPPKTIYIALEKRYVFTLEHLDSVAPCYETFLSLLDKVKTENLQCTWKATEIPLDFPKYFTYERVAELVLWEISSSLK